ncbi:3'-5' exoribonuclease YhaM family protein [Luteolibacter sp. AS25]|uniref:3'-5' exoribonuclease YhaM family protein n=1 Tax=Luteolibacter sp. AS25 TaxID=3135776 RepID=UPI00398AE4F1
MSLISISSLKEQAGEVPLIASVSAQLQARAVKTTKGGKPYFDLVFADATGSLNLKVWSDTPLHTEAENLPLNAIVRLEGEWTQNQYGVNGNGVSWARLDDAAIADFLAGDPVLRKKQEKDFQDISEMCAAMVDPRLRRLAEYFFEEMGDRFRRTAAAKKNHHARRGGLVEHVAQMMRSSVAICGIYPELNRDLMVAGVLFHDCGKLWENSYPEDGFGQIHSRYGEMLGHIPLGIELVNKLWNDLMEAGDFGDFTNSKPSTEDVRLHLLHLIGSHHGQLEFGSPVLPKTPEAYALHYIDNLDAKMEMLRDAYPQANEVAKGIYERVFPLAANLVEPLGEFSAGE